MARVVRKKPGFRIITSASRPPTKAVEILEKSLKNIKILKQKATVGVVYSKDRAPAGFDTAYRECRG